MNILQQFNILLQKASQWPKFFWFHEFLTAKYSFLLDLKDIAKGINKENNSYKRLEFFINILQKEKIEELELAEGFASLAEIFSLSDFTQKELIDYQNLSQAFLKRVKNEKRFQDLRAKLLKTLSPAKQKEYDQKLFYNEGINYCLEYYLAFYKALADLKEQERKSEFMNIEEIDLGFGKTAGLRKDLEHDESLTKFIFIILNDVIRSELLNHYYQLKNSVLKTEDVYIVEKEIKEFILRLLIIFQRQGINRLTSEFFKPYGDKPELDYLIKIFSK